MSPDDVRRVSDALGDGDLAVIPTDTVYGLIADPTSEIAMGRLFEAKHRPSGVPVAVLVGSIEQAHELVIAGPRFDELAGRHWPGPLTLVAPTRGTADLHIGSSSTVGVRLPAHDFVVALAHEFGPIAATSANIHGGDTAVTAAEAAALFGSTVRIVIDGGPLEGAASTVVDLSIDPPAVLRQGDLPVDLPA